MNSTSVAVGSGVTVVSGVGVAWGVQPRMARRVMLRIAVRAKKWDRVFGMKKIRQDQTRWKAEEGLHQTKYFVGRQPVHPDKKAAPRACTDYAIRHGYAS